MPDSECVEIRGLASNHIDGELSEEQADKVRGHLDWCKPCVAFFNTLRSTIGLLGSTQKQEATPSLRQRLRESLQNDHVG